jgi:hypothetical protein
MAGSIRRKKVSSETRQFCQNHVRTNGQGINLKYHFTLCSYESFLILFQLQLKFTTLPAPAQH